MQEILKGRGTGLGTCGELAQGPLPGGGHFHVTCPINKTSSATVVLRDNGTKNGSIQGLGANKAKARQALAAAAAVVGASHRQIHVDLWSDLDIAKGLGSSTADICAVIRGLTNALHTELSPAAIATIAAEVESSDGTMYPGINVVDHKTGRLLYSPPWWPSMTVVMLVPPGKYNTDSADFTGQDQQLHQYSALLDMIQQAAEQRSPELWGEIATRSAYLNQRWVPNPLFSLVAPHVQDLGAIGINIGHTGTVAGLLFQSDDAGREAAAEAMLKLPQFIPASIRVDVVNTPNCPN